MSHTALLIATDIAIFESRHLALSSAQVGQQYMEEGTRTRHLRYTWEGPPSLGNINILQLKCARQQLALGRAQVGQQYMEEEDTRT